MLTKVIKQSFSFNMFNAFRGIKQAVRAPVKHFKAFTEDSGRNYSIQTNTTQEAFDQVSHQWQAFVGHNPFDVQTYNYLQNAQPANFGTVDNPLAIFTADAPFRYVGCSGPQNEDDYESHQLFWMMIRQGPLQRCPVCGQVFKLVRLRNQFSSDMDYYMPNFNKLWIEDMGQHDNVVNMSLTKANTHFEHSQYEQPQDTVYTFITSDQHDRILTDPAYRARKLNQDQQRAKVYLMAMEDYEREKQLKFQENKYRQPTNKIEYENTLQAELLIKKLDRHFRKVAKYQSRKYVDPQNHERREKRMLERASKRWDGAYTIFSGTLNQQQLRYRDYFQTDLDNYKEDERLEEFLDKQELLGETRFNLSQYDFQQGYTMAPEDDQTSYIEKKIFKFKYRKALDSVQDYERRNNRMIERQRQRFNKNNSLDLIQNYLRNPSEENQAKYFELVANESLTQYNDYFETEKDQFDQHLMQLSSRNFSLVFENWQIPLQDKSSYQTYQLPEWNDEKGLWANALAILKEVNGVGQKISAIEQTKAPQSISSSSLVEKNK